MGHHGKSGKSDTPFFSLACAAIGIHPAAAEFMEAGEDPANDLLEAQIRIEPK